MSDDNQRGTILCHLRYFSMAFIVFLISIKYYKRAKWKYCNGWKLVKKRKNWWENLSKDILDFLN